MKKYRMFAILFTIMALFCVGCAGDNKDNSPAPTTSSIIGNATGTQLGETQAETIMITVKSSHEAMNAFYSISEMNFEGRSQAMEVWITVFDKELTAAETSPELERVGNFVPSGQEGLQQKFMQKRESVWYRELDKCQNSRQFYSAYQFQPFWLMNERPRYQDWCSTGVSEVNSAKSTQELLDLQNFLPREQSVMLALEYAGWKLRLAEEIEKNTMSEEIRKIIDELMRLGMFNEKG